MHRIYQINLFKTLLLYLTGLYKRVRENKVASRGHPSVHRIMFEQILSKPFKRFFDDDQERFETISIAFRHPDQARYISTGDYCATTLEIIFKMRILVQLLFGNI